MDHITNCPNAMFVRKPTAERVIHFLQRHTTHFGIPEKIRAHPATFFRSENLEDFCKEFFINYIECPVCDHCGNGKIERLNRAMNEQLIAEKSIVTEKANTGFARLLFALRMAAAANSNESFQKLFGRRLNTIKNLLTEKHHTCLENDNTLPLSSDEFPKDDDSSVFLRDRTKNTK